MDELRIKEKSSNKRKKEKEPDWFLTVTTVQIIMCIVISVAVFFVSTSKGDSAQRLRNDFQNLMSMTLESSEAEDVFSKLKEKIIKKDSEENDDPLSDRETDSDNETSETVSDNAEEELSKTQTTQTEDTCEETTNDEKDVSDEDLNETKAVMASGGKDIKLYSAKENTTFSPVATTCPIVRPVDGGWYSSYFGYRINPITNENSFHTGLDIAVAQGSKIHAAYNGQVRLVGEDDHSGKYILLSHDDGFETFYCHCSKILAEEGANIRSGETIALVGSTGWSTGPHLHFEVRKNGERLDPLSIIENDN